MTSTATVLLADDDEAICTVVEQAIRRQGMEVLATDNGGTLLQWIAEGRGDVVVTDVLMPGHNGLDLLPKIKQTRPELPVIVISAQNTLLTAVKANERGAFEYLPKPFDLNELVSCIKKSLTQYQDNENFVPAASLPDSLSLVGTSIAMQEIYRVLARLVGVDLTVILMGESGTGKELIARALHQLGKRKDKPFVAINMAAIPRELVESELFGHEKGAFTGAAARKSGKFEQAEGGTLFLDEIGDMPLDAQTKLLRVLQQGEYTTVGGNHPIKTDVRILCATHRDLSELIRQGQFREDLFYRLNVVPLRIPPLRDRREDVASLAQHFLSKATSRGLPTKQLSSAAVKALQSYNWPGNVRELENVMYRIAALHSELTIGPEAIRQQLAQSSSNPTASETPSSLCDIVRQQLKAYFDSHAYGLPPQGLYDRIMPLVEKPLIELTLQATEGNQIKAAELLGINRNTLRKRMGELGISKSKNQAEG